MNGHNHITIELPPSEIEFVRSFAKKNNLSVDEVFDRLVKNLERVTHRRVDSTLRSMVGVIPDDVSIDDLRMEYLTEKYLGNGRND